MSRGTQRTISLPEGWLPRLEALIHKLGWDSLDDFCEDPSDVENGLLISKKTLLRAERPDSTGEITVAKFDVLRKKLDEQTREDLLERFAAPKPKEAPAKKDSGVKDRIHLAQDQARDERGKEAIATLEEALRLARASGEGEEEAEVLIALCILSSDRRGVGDRRRYFAELERKKDSIQDTALKVLYHRSKAAVLQDAGDHDAGNDELRAALVLCDEAKEDPKHTLAIQACVIRSHLVLRLCNENRMDEAKPLLDECEAFARAHTDLEDAELVQAALESGICWSLKSNDEGAAIERIGELEMTAKDNRLAGRIGSQLVEVCNRASHMRAHPTAIAAAEASLRLAKHHRDERFEVGVLYTLAAAHYRAGNLDAARIKAEALIDACGPKDEAIRFATAQLISVIAREQGDSQRAVDQARAALTAAAGDTDGVAIAKLALADALSDNGETEEALRQASECYELMRQSSAPPRMLAEVLRSIVDLSSQLGDLDTCVPALTALKALPENDDKEDRIEAVKESAVRRVMANTELRKRMSTMASEDVEADSEGPQPPAHSLPQANERVIRHLDALVRETPQQQAALYDFWGRGNLAKVLHNARSFKDAFNITLEVRTLDDVKSAVRLWSLYTDLLILLWKGPTRNGQVIAFIEEDYEQAGGWGYMMAAGDRFRAKGSEKTFHAAVGFASLLPEEVVAFLFTEARSLLLAGKFLIVPATGVGCVHPGHGPMEALLAETANAIPVLGRRGGSNLPIGLLPYSPDAPLDILTDLVQTEAEHLRKLRLLLMKKTRELGHDDIARRELGLQIDDALRDLADATNTIARKESLTVTTEPLHQVPERRPIEFDSTTEARLFKPLLSLKTMGYGWTVGSLSGQVQGARFQPEAGDLIGSWLAPPLAGWTIPTVVAKDG